MPSETLAPVVAVLNMKGGVGKTTISAHVMRVLYHHYRINTLLVDLDPQFNLSQALVSRAIYDDLKDSNRTIFAVMEPPPLMGLHDIRTSDSPPPKAADVIYRLRYFLKLPITLDLLPGDFRLVKYSMIDSRRKLDSVQTRFLRFIGESRKHYRLICIDCNPSSSFITSCALHACTHILVPIRPDRYSVLGLEILYDFVSEIPTISPKPEVLALLNGIPRRKYDSAVEDELRAHDTFGRNVLTSPVYQSGLLEAKTGYTGFATDKPVAWRDLLKEGNLCRGGRTRVQTWEWHKMHRILSKVLLLLAGSGLSHREIRDFVKEMRDLPPSQLADAVLHLRRTAPDVFEMADSMVGSDRESRGLRKPRRPVSDVCSRVVGILTEEAGLTVNQAALELLTSLKRERPEVARMLKQPNKESLYKWLERVLSKIEPSELLHHAILVRNKYVHDRDRDWPLLPR